MSRSTFDTTRYPCYQRPGSTYQVVEARDAVPQPRSRRSPLFFFFLFSPSSFSFSTSPPAKLPTSNRTIEIEPAEKTDFHTFPLCKFLLKRNHRCGKRTDRVLYRRWEERSFDSVRSEREQVEPGRRGSLERGAVSTGEERNIPIMPQA